MVERDLCAFNTCVIYIIIMHVLYHIHVHARRYCILYSENFHFGIFFVSFSLCVMHVPVIGSTFLILSFEDNVSQAVSPAQYDVSKFIFISQIRQTSKARDISISSLSTSISAPLAVAPTSSSSSSSSSTHGKSLTLGRHSSK